MDSWHLMRVNYKTDIREDDPEYQGSISSTIPAAALKNYQIVNVDWSERGFVEVTYLIVGPGIS